jgi:hypothetical protein
MCPDVGGAYIRGKRLGEASPFPPFLSLIQGRISDFKLGGALKKNAPSGGRRDILGVFRVENHDFTPKNLIFFNGGGRREIVLGISCEKSRFYAKKYIFVKNIVTVGCACYIYNTCALSKHIGNMCMTGADPGGRTRRARPLKLTKIYFLA